MKAVPDSGRQGENGMHDGVYPCVRLRGAPKQRTEIIRNAEVSL